VYSSVLLAAEGMNERYKGHMKTPSLEPAEVAAVLVLVAVVAVVVVVFDVAERSKDIVTGWGSWIDGH